MTPTYPYHFQSFVLPCQYSVNVVFVGARYIFHDLMHTSMMRERPVAQLLEKLRRSQGPQASGKLGLRQKAGAFNGWFTIKKVCFCTFHPCLSCVSSYICTYRGRADTPGGERAPDLLPCPFLPKQSLSTHTETKRRMSCHVMYYSDIAISYQYLTGKSMLR